MRPRRDMRTILAILVSERNALELPANDPSHSSSGTGRNAHHGDLSARGTGNRFLIVVLSLGPSARTIIHNDHRIRIYHRSGRHGGDQCACRARGRHRNGHPAR